jgi:oxygen-dependent protoporphyrinogen oxidase
MWHAWRRMQVRARSVALTVPAYVAADLLRRDCPDAAAALKSLDYPPVAAVTLAYPKSALRPDRLDAAQNLPGARPCALRASG